MDISVILNQMGILVIIMITGFVCAKIRLTGPEFNKSCSSVTLNVLLVGVILSSAMQSDISLSIGKLAGLIGIGFLILIVSGLFGALAPRLFGVKAEDRGLAFFTIMLMNTVFVAYPVIEAVYGVEGVFYASISNIPFNVVAYTIGIWAIQGKGGKISLRSVVSPPLVATVIGITIILTGIKMPKVIVDSCAALGKATVPMCMLVIGTSLGGASLGSALSNWRAYLISAVRLLICPLACWLVLRIFVSDPVILGVYTIMSSAPVAMIATVFAVQYKKNEIFSSECIFISTVLSAATMPLMIWLLLL